MARAILNFHVPEPEEIEEESSAMPDLERDENLDGEIQLPPGMELDTNEELEEDIYTEDEEEDDDDEREGPSDFDNLMQSIRENENLTRDQQEVIEQLLQRHEHVFRPTTTTADVPPVELPVINERVVQRAQFPLSPAERDYFTTKIEEMLELGMIEETSSPWNAPVFFVKKKSGKMRMLIDLRGLNKTSKQLAQGLPKLDTILHQLKGIKYLATVDLRDGYHQIPVTNETASRLAFTAPNGAKYQYRVLPQGHRSSPAAYQEVVRENIAVHPNTMSYLDDIIIWGHTFEEFFEALQSVLERLSQAGMRANPSKSRIAQKEIEYLGHIVGLEGVRADPAKLDAIAAFPRPSNKRELRGFLGLISYYREHMGKELSKILAPLHELTNKSGPFDIAWTEETNQAFIAAKELAHKSLMLAYPDSEGLMWLETDASRTAIGFALWQKSNGKTAIVQTGSRKLKKCETKRAIIEIEALAIHYALKRLRQFVEGRHVFVLTDHSPLRYLLGPYAKQSITGAFWLKLNAELSHFHYTLLHISGADNKIADYLSRRHQVNFLIDNPEAQSTRAYDETLTRLLYMHVRLGHVGINGIRQQMIRESFEPDVSREELEWMLDYITKSCSCAMEKRAAPPRITPHWPDALYPLQEVSTDTFTWKGMKVQTVIDHYSRYLWARPKPDNTAETAARILMELFDVIGFPDKLISDGGPENTFKLPVKVQHQKTAARFPQTNSFIERVHGTLIDILKMSPYDNPEDSIRWAVALYNLRYHTSIGEIPHFAFFGRDPRTTVVAPRSADPEAERRPTVIPLEIAAYNKRFKIGQLVAKKVTGMKGKDKPNYVGPYRLLSLKPGGDATIRKPGGNLVLKTTTRLLKVIYRPMYHDWRINRTYLQEALLELQQARGVDFNLFVDMFSSEENSVCRFRVQDAWSFNTYGKYVYANPPFSELDQLVVKLVREGPREVILIVPHFNERMFYQALLHYGDSYWVPLDSRPDLFLLRGHSTGPPRFETSVVHIIVNTELDFETEIYRRLNPFFKEQWKMANVGKSSGGCYVEEEEEALPIVGNVDDEKEEKEDGVEEEEIAGDEDGEEEEVASPAAARRGNVPQETEKPGPSPSLPEDQDQETLGAVRRSSRLRAKMEKRAHLN